MGDLIAGLGGAAMGVVAPELGILTLVAKGLELAQKLLEKNDQKDVGKILDMLSELVKQSTEGKTGAAAAEPQAFDNPIDNGLGMGGIPPNDEIGNAAQASPVSHDLLPQVDGSAAGDRRLSESASQYVQGSDANKSRALKPGSQEWTTVMWAMQQNPNVNYDADSKRFFEKMDNGSKRDLGSLADAEKKVSETGGFDRNNPTAASALGDYFNKQVGQADDHPRASRDVEKFAEIAAQLGRDPDEVNQELDILKKKLMAAEDLDKNNNVDISMTVNQNMSIRA